jgi:Putative Flp pilus-assembly TadE/G-like
MKVWKPFFEQRGSIAIMVAVSAVVLLGIAAFVIDFGFTWVTTNELQNAADAGALAGAGALGHYYCPATDPKNPCLSPAMLKAITIGDAEPIARPVVRDVVGKNYAATVALAIDDGDIEVGWWDPAPKTFSATYTGDPAEYSPPNAVRVRTRRDTTTNTPIQTFLGNIFGVASINLSKPATAALTGIGKVEPGGLEPLALSEQHECKDVITLQKTKASCAGWTGFFGNTNTKDMGILIDGIRTGSIESPQVMVSDSLNFTGGVTAATFNAFYNLWMVKKDPVTGIWRVLLPVYEDSGTCDNPTKSLPIKGFASMDISKVDCTASDPKEPYKNCAPGKEDIVEGRIACGMIDPGRGGGGEFGTVGSIPGIVQ